MARPDRFTTIAENGKSGSTIRIDMLPPALASHGESTPDKADVNSGVLGPIKPTPASGRSLTDTV